jgi:hypothetical protein
MRSTKQQGKKKRRAHADPEQSLRTDALRAARDLPRRHRTLFDADRKRFRQLIQQAQGRVFRLRPGPKADARIAQAAREKDRGAEFRELFARYIDGYASMSQFTRTLAEDAFRRKVNEHLRHSRYHVARGKEPAQQFRPTIRPGNSGT